jgi:1-deoxy-D-xylulose-5-phosphate synthase
MQRAYDQVIHDVCIQNLPVIFCLDRAGFAGADGPTHHGAYDIAFMRCIPNMVVASPMNEEELRNLMFLAQSDSFQAGGEAITLRYPRGEGVTPDWRKPFSEIKVGEGRKLKDGDDMAILSFGPTGNEVTKAIDILEPAFSVAHYDMRFAKPLDEALLHEVFEKFDQIITVEDGCLQGGIGSAILEFMVDHGYSAKVKRLGIPDRLVEHGEQYQLYAECGYDADGIVEAARSLQTQRHLA